MKVLAGCAVRERGRGLILLPSQKNCRYIAAWSFAAQLLVKIYRPSARLIQAEIKILSPVLPLSCDALAECPVQGSGGTAELIQAAGLPRGSHLPAMVCTHPPFAFPAAPPLEPVYPQYSNSLTCKMFR